MSDEVQIEDIEKVRWVRFGCLEKRKAFRN
jgi:hypothetical protein